MSLSPAELLDRVRNAENLPSPPTVAMEVLRLSRRDDVKVDQLVKVIQNDPALTAKLLKLVNSPMFGLSRRVTSLHQATVVLGIRTVKVFALSFSLVDTMNHCGNAAFDYESYWRRSLTTAAAARLLGKAIKSPQAEEAFVSGLLCDLGIVAAVRAAPELYAPVLEAWKEHSRPLSLIETSLLGITHAALGRELLKAWGLPEQLCDAVGAHHGDGIEQLSGATLEIARIVRAAAAVADVFCKDVCLSQLEQVKATCIQTLTITPASLEAALGTLDQNVRDAAATLAVKVGQTVNYAQLQAESAVALAQLSMAAELERADSSRRAETATMEAHRLTEQNRLILETASTDALTKVSNRAAFDARLNEELHHARSVGRELGLIMMDVDHFKHFNDTYGHQAGDEVLRHVGETLRNVASDIGFVARYGGEEFAVIVADASAEALRQLAEDIRRSIERESVRHEGKELHVTASFGATCVRPTELSGAGAELVSRADRLLYAAKKKGRNRVEAS